MTIVSISGSSCTVKLGNGNTVDLTIDDDTSIAAGYNPQEGDVVDVVYTKDDMVLKDIELKDRPQPADDGADESADESGDEGGDD